MTSNKKHLLPLVAFLTIPVIFLAGGTLFATIDPERLAGHTHYVRNFRLLELARGGVMLAMFGSVAIAWLVACLLLLESRSRSYGWLPLALLGPIGLAILASLRDLNSQPWDLYERFIRSRNVFCRIAYEMSFFLLGWMLAWQMMLSKREITVSLQAAATGLSRNQILDQQNASSGMWAFSELNEVMYFFTLLYLLRPACVNLVGSVLKHRRPPEVA